ncbi:hypothetical protein cyc_00062 [Cyclospora cayetanensis]|uniref:Uncharacterized protein n=1 Tax=Cyclospora cayetanensis TaxID=88456 RepID=A0A1D3CVJ5_9EIME|nr:hypothetical protein cyc_00062 [Cyclospora cayetanensis]
MVGVQLAGNLLLALWSGLPFDDISPAACESAIMGNYVFKNVFAQNTSILGFADHYYYVLRPIYYTFLFVVGGLVYFSLPPYARDMEPVTSDERERARSTFDFLHSMPTAMV